MSYTALGFPLATPQIDHLYNQQQHEEQQQQTIPTYKWRLVLSYDGTRYSGLYLDHIYMSLVRCFSVCLGIAKIFLLLIMRWLKLFYTIRLAVSILNADHTEHLGTSLNSSNETRT